MLLVVTICIYVFSYFKLFLLFLDTHIELVVTMSDQTRATPRVLVLDVGLSSKPPFVQAGQILELNPDDHLRHPRVVVPQLSLPDGIAVDAAHKRMYWTCMGIPGKWDGAVHSAALDGSDRRTLVAPGRVNTPKQLALDESAGKIYFCDREGLGVYRCNLDGLDLEPLVLNGEPTTPPDAFKWCVGVAVAPALGKFFWTQKGPAKSGQGRIFCANIVMPSGQSATSRGDVQAVLQGLPEPIDLEFDEASRALYWTDRGEVPFGNSLNRAWLDESGIPRTIMTASLSLTGEKQEKKHELLTRNLNEAIGLKLDPGSGHIYIADLGGSIYRYDLDGKKKERLYFEDSRAFTGITIF